MKRIAVAAVSARALAELAAGEGFEVVALDVFGDADTRRAATRWQAIGAPVAGGGLAIDDARLLQALAQIAERDEAPGWIAGAGFEGRPDLLDAGARALPLIGNGAAVLRRLHDARGFFRVLDEHRLPHPPVRFDSAPAGWLRKDFAGCGGWQVQPAQAETALTTTSQYLQQERRGAMPMSATFIADGQRAMLIGCNLQLLAATSSRPFAWGGVIGPVPVSDGVKAQVAAALEVLVPASGLRGLGSLDFLLLDARIELLEINARVPASAQLYDADGLIGAHVQACARSVVALQACARGAVALQAAPAGAPRGIAVVYAARDLHVGAVAARWLAAQPGVHDVPAQAAVFRAGDPLCSVSATGADAAAVQRQLAQRACTLRTALETFDE